MKTITRVTLAAILLATLAPSLHAEFLLVKVRENTANNILGAVIAISSLLVLITLNKTRSKGGRGR